MNVDWPIAIVLTVLILTLGTIALALIMNPKK
jgi:hypothetical protein